MKMIISANRMDRKGNHDSGYWNGGWLGNGLNERFFSEQKLPGLQFIRLPCRRAAPPTKQMGRLSAATNLPAGIFSLN